MCARPLSSPQSCPDPVSLRELSRCHEDRRPRIQDRSQRRRPKLTEPHRSVREPAIRAVWALSNAALSWVAADDANGSMQSVTVGGPGLVAVGATPRGDTDDEDASVWIGEDQ